MRIIVATLIGVIALAAVAAQAALGTRNENWRPFCPGVDLQPARPSLRGWLALRPPARLARLLVVGLRSSQMTWLSLAVASMVRALEAARICLIFFGCALVGWALGFAMGYRRGAVELQSPLGLKASDAAPRQPAARARPRAPGTGRQPSRPGCLRTTSPRAHLRASHPRNRARSRRRAPHAFPKVSSPSHWSRNSRQARR